MADNSGWSIDPAPQSGGWSIDPTPEEAAAREQWTVDPLAPKRPALGALTPDQYDVSTFGKRPDGSAKGTGFLGVFRRPDGSVASEESVGLEINGKEMDVPTFVPGLTQGEIDWLLKTPIDQVAKKLPDSIRQKVVAHAKERIAAGLSPFKGPGESDTPLLDAVSGGPTQSRRITPSSPDDFASAPTVRPSKRDADRVGGQGGVGQYVSDLGRSAAAGVVSVGGMGLRGLGREGQRIRAVLGQALGGDDKADAFMEHWFAPNSPLATVVPGITILNPAMSEGLTKSGEAVQGVSDKINVPAERQNQVGNIIASATGQVAGMIGLGMVGGESAVNASILGQSFDQIDQSLKEKGVKDSSVAGLTAQTAGAAAMSVLERTGLDVILEGVPSGIRNRVVRGLADVGITGGFEAAEEVAQQIVQNFATKLGVDPNTPVRDWGKGLTEGVFPNAVGGFGAGAIARAVLGRWGAHAPQTVAEKEPQSGRSYTVEDAVQELGMTPQEAQRKYGNPNVPPPLDMGTPPGIREGAALNAAQPTPEDEASPLPTDLIRHGKMTMAAATATGEADQALSSAGMPGVGTRVEVTHNGRTSKGAVADAWTVDMAGQTSVGVKIRLDDGTMIEEPVDTLRDMGVTVTPERLPDGLPAGDVTDPVVQEFASRGMANVTAAVNGAESASAGGWSIDTPEPAKGAERPSSAASGANLPEDVVQGLMRQGIPEHVARAAAAGTVAEAGGDENAVNQTSGAIGLGQWLGSRKAELIRRYGPNPTRAQQIEFLAYELKGGDPGGKAVLAAKDEASALDAYITKFMRPAAGAETEGDLERGRAALGGRSAETASATETENPAETSTAEGEPDEAAAEAPAQEPEEPAPATESAADEEHGAALAGEKIDDDYTAFAPHSGTLGIPRADMPQIKAEHRGAMVNFLNARGISHEEVTLPASELKPSQAEFSPAKVAQAKAFTGGDRAILIDESNHVVDGHHQFVAAHDGGQEVRTIRLNAPVQKIADELRDMPSAETAEGGITAQASGRNSSADLSEGIGKMGGGAVDAMYDALLKKIDAGDTTENGQPSALLQVAKAIKATGADVDHSNIRQIADAYTKVTSTGEQRQIDLRKVVDSFKPERPRFTIAPDFAEKTGAEAAPSKQDAMKAKMAAKAIATGRPTEDNGRGGPDGAAEEQGNGSPPRRPRKPTPASARESGTNSSQKRAAKPMNVIAFVRSIGGIKDNEGHDLSRGRGLRRHPGLINNKSGHGVDFIGEALWEAGYIGTPDDRPTEAEVLELLDEADRRPIYPQHQQEQAAQASRAEIESGREDEARFEIQSVADQAELHLTTDEIEAAMEYHLGRGMTVEGAIERAVYQSAALDLLEVASVTRSEYPYADVADEIFRGDEAEARGGAAESDERPVAAEAAATEGEAPAREPGKAAAPEAGADDEGRGPAGPAQLDAFGTREGDERRALERQTEGRQRSTKQQKAPGEDGGLFDTLETTRDMFAQPREVAPAATPAIEEPGPSAADENRGAAAEAPPKAGMVPLFDDENPDEQIGWLDPTTGSVAPTRLEDVGEKIGGARKDMFAERGLQVSDLDNMSRGEAHQLTTKENVWPKPDYAKLVEQGVEPEAAAAQKLLRDSLAAKPKIDSDEGRTDYIEAMGAARQVLADTKTAADVRTVQTRLYDALGVQHGSYGYYDRNDERQKAARRRLFSVFKGRSASFSIDYKARKKIEQMLAQGWPTEKAEPWTRRFNVRPSYDQTNTFRVTDKMGRTLERGLPSQEVAEAKARELYEGLTKNSDGTKKQPQRPHLDKLERTGMDVRNGRDIRPEDFLSDFGFRGVEFGNWVANDERQKAVNLAYEALHDLADTLGVPAETLSLGGQLGLAFGARGKGKAAAHYEPGKLVINLTKLSGAGSLAHEWGHALDHYFGQLDSDTGTRGAPDYASGGRNDYSFKALGNLRPELAQAFDGVMGALFSKEKTRADTIRDLELKIEQVQAGIARQEDRIAAVSGDAKAQRQFRKQSQEWIEFQKRRLKGFGNRLAEARDESKPLNAEKVESSFYQEAQKLSGKAGKRGYWARPTELFARAFESYVFDKIKDRGNVSQYLVQGVEPERHASDLFAGNPYPTGEERARIDAAFDKLFETVEVRGIPGPREGGPGRTLAQADRPSDNVFDGDEPAPAAPRQTVEISPDDVDRIRARLLQRMEQLGLKDRYALEVANGLKLARNGTLGQIDLYNRIISIALDRSRNPEHSLNHEAIHALGPSGLRLITPAEWDVLVEAAWANDRLREWAQTSPAYQHLSLDDQKEEAAAEYVADAVDAMRGRAVEGVPLGRVQGMIFRAVHRVARFWNALRHAVSYLRTGEAAEDRPIDVVLRIDRGKVGERRSRVEGKPVSVTFGRRLQGAENRLSQAEGRSEERSPNSIAPDAINIEEKPGEDNGPDIRFQSAPPAAAPGPMGRTFDDQEAAPPRLLAPLRALVDSVGPNGTSERLGEAIDRVRYVLQDRMLPVLRVQARIERMLGRKLSDEENPYLGEELMSGRVGARLEQLTDQHVEPLFESMREEKVSPDELETYLYARHAKERNAQIAKINPEFADGTGSGMTDEEADAILAAATDSGKRPALDRLAQKVDDILDFALRTRVESGLLSEEEANLWRSTYRHYVPLRGRETDALAPQAARIARQSGISVKGKESRRAFGRKSRAADILPYVILQAEESIVRGEQNRVAQAFLDLAKAAPDPNFWRVDKIRRVPVFNKASGTVSYRSESRIAAEDAPYTVSAKVDGAEHRVTMNRENPAAVRVASAMRNLDIQQFKFLVGTLGRLNRFLSAINTSYSPEFVISNALRDLQTAAINLSAEKVKGLERNVLKDYPAALKAATKGAFGKGSGEWGKWYSEFKLAGGRTYFNHTDDVRALQKRVQQAAKKANNRLGAMQMLRAVRDVIENVNSGVENALRLATYKNARQAGLSQKQAASLAKGVTVNFNRTGTAGPLINSLYLFFNASMQGSARIFVAMKSRKVQGMLLGAVIAGFWLDLLNRWWSDKDKDGDSFYAKVPEFEKERNLIVMLPGEEGKYVKIPLPWGYNVFPNFGRMLAELYSGQRPMDAIANWATGALDSFNPVGGANSLLNIISPTVTDPLVDLTQNRDYAGRPIMPDQEQHGPQVPDAQRYWQSVPAYDKAVTDFLAHATGGDDVRPGAIDISPETLDYLQQTVFGAAGNFVRNNVALGSKLLSKDPENAFDKNDIPFARRVVGDKPVWYDKAAFYARLAEVDQDVAYAKDYIKAGDRAGLDRLKDDQSDVLDMRLVAKSAEKHMRKLRKEQREVDEAFEKGSIDEQEKRVADSLIDARQQEVIDAFNRRYLEAVKRPLRP